MSIVIRDASLQTHKARQKRALQNKHSRLSGDDAVQRQLACTFDKHCQSAAEQRQRILITVIGHEETVMDMHGKDRYQQQQDHHYRSRTSQQPQQQAQTAKELGAARHQRHQITRCQAQAFHVLRSAFQAITAEGPEQLLTTVSDKGNTDNNAQQGKAVTGASAENRFDHCVHVGNSGID
ncbi:hypothetical protein ALP42_102751 [Pseudomonas savastanoi pv. nerii]|uniref:CRIB domain-containing protein n=1 Tax=Pseudomonas savastanoi pv. nerii TaxID=360921 RepID=A0AB74B9D3_PSESS|nr:hypothetical protein ALO58_102609 [Pseudomonas savastanoi pv. savastanoi]RMR63730.1 hypothetical protein ALP80_102859 [Pseudomonas savastanoi pv. fraxini]RMT67059.1 hypothetical protein ALP42_102751 [Pseudomonas savastanoi pv. nerii]